MSFITRNLKQSITFWSSPTPDGFGGNTFAVRKVIKGRWEDKTVLFINEKGIEVRSNAIVYLKEDAALGDWLFLGSSTAVDPTTIDGAREVRNFEKIPTLRAKNFARKAML